MEGEDFAGLATKYPEILGRYVYANRQGRQSVNFNDPYVQRAVCRTLLLDRYALHVDLPIDRLCPTVPSRENYLKFIHTRLLNTLESSSSSPTIRGIDIGTGASCIYPLIGCRLFDYRWEFDCTDIDRLSVEWASRNVKQNGLEDRIKVHWQPDPAHILPFNIPALQGGGADGANHHYDFVMCNPPFYDDFDTTSSATTTATAALIKPPLDRQCVASRTELMTEGGELAFARRMFEESLMVSPVDRVHWYTCLFGRKRDMEQFRQLIIGDYRTVKTIPRRPVRRVVDHTLVQGRTRRWVLAWSFVDAHVK